MNPTTPNLAEGTWTVIEGNRVRQANVKDSTLDTLTDMLQRAAQAQIDGTWRSGGMAGSWSIVR